MNVQSKQRSSEKVDVPALKLRLEKARLAYKPIAIKYLLIAEAPPDSLDRFFYYEDVTKHDYLFLGVAEALYPDLKRKFIESKRSCDIKRSILFRLQAYGFYLLDLSELPLGQLENDLASQLPNLIERIEQVTDRDIKIILIKATVYDTAYQSLSQRGFKNVVDYRIPFPGQGGQKKFKEEFKNALVTAGFKIQPL